MERLVPTIQNYDWGDTRFIADLQGRDLARQPEAELWMGSHQKAPSTLYSSGLLLGDAISADPVALLGQATADRFGELPFLVKVLAAAQPLSIQAHPSADQAREGFARENAEGIALDSPTRTYLDRNAKPELVCALSTFEAKCGFRPLESTRELFDGLAGSQLDELRERLADPGSPGSVLADVLSWLLGMDSGEAVGLAGVVARASAAIATDSPWQGEIEWTARIDRSYPGDVGVVVALLLNHVVLDPGQALFLAAGNLHSYLRGAAVEVMSNSDNVIRGGLTSKHVDTDELLAVLDCTPHHPVIQRANRPEHTFDSPVDEFALTRLEVTRQVNWNVAGPEIILVTEGVMKFTDAAGDSITAESGVPVWVPADAGSYAVRGQGVLFRTTLGRR